MLVIGLTGSIGMGKSTVAARLRALGIAVCDADAEVHKLYEGAAVAAIEAAFPGTTAGGKVDRQKLGRPLLDKPDELQAPGGHRASAGRSPPSAISCAAQAAKGAPLAVLEIPLLLETGGEARVDVVVVCSAPAEAQRERVMQRPGMTSGEARTAAGAPDAGCGEARARRFRCGHRRHVCRDRRAGG